MGFTSSARLRLLLPSLALSLGLLTGCGGQATQSPTSTTSSASPHKININSAILSELDKIEGQIGIPSLSNRIQAARPYASPEELVSKKILTQEQFDRIKDQVSVEDVELVGEAKDIDFMTKLGLMRGHLLVAKEWLDRKQPALALPHRRNLRRSRRPA
jgi:Helix-hairpin-helix motif